MKREPLRLANELKTIQEFYEAAVTLSINSSDTEFLADRTLFQRAIGNPITNALTHSPRNGRVEIFGVASKSGMRISVVDSGSGIASEHLPHVFDRLYRGTGARSGSTGHGLGLSIVKSVVEWHGGAVGIQSMAQRGTTVETSWPGSSTDSL